MSETFAYVFQQGTLDVTVATPATNSTGFGQGYAVTAISGTLAGGVSGEVGIGGQVQQSFDGGFDNAIFLGNAAGFDGSATGIDAAGLEFSAGGVEYNLISDHGTLILIGANGSANNLQLVSSDAPCYCPGTLIATDNGDVVVQDLKIGDNVATVSGRTSPIRWIGRRSYVGRFANHNPNILPVCIRAGSLGGNLPARDLWVSPLHVMLLHGVLVPAGLLVNGVSITQAKTVKRVDYIHIELDQHDVILAEGAASESFVDDGSRGMFHNAAEFAALYPMRQSKSALYCAPRIEEGELLAAIRREIDAVAGLSSLRREASA